MWEGNCDALGRLERIDGALGLGRFAAEFVGHASYAVPNDSTPATSPLSIFLPIFHLFGSHCQYFFVFYQFTLYHSLVFAPSVLMARLLLDLLDCSIALHAAATCIRFAEVIELVGPGVL